MHSITLHHYSLIPSFIIKEISGARAALIHLQGGVTMEGEGKKRILVLWTSGEKDTALNMVFMYSLNAKLKGWWDEVTLLVWGASTKLLGTDRGNPGKAPGPAEGRGGNDRLPGLRGEPRPRRETRIPRRAGVFHRGIPEPANPGGGYRAVGLGRKNSGARRTGGPRCSYASCFEARQARAMELTFPSEDSPRLVRTTGAETPRTIPAIFAFM